MTLFKTLALLLEEVTNTKKRLAINSLVSEFLKSLDDVEVEPAVSFILGHPFPKSRLKTLDISWATLSEILRKTTGSYQNVFEDAFRRTGDVGSAAQAVFESNQVNRQSVLFEKQLSILEVRRVMEIISDSSGPGMREKKERLVASLLSQASPVEVKYLVKLFVGEMRTGLSEGLMQQAISSAFGVPLPVVHMAAMKIGDVAETAGNAKSSGVEGLLGVGFKVFRPVTLMLAQTADSVDAVLLEHGGETAFEYKYDGVRVQIHKLDGKVQVFSRRLTESTRSLPEIVDEVKEQIKAREVILEGEVVAVDLNGVAVPFQHLMRRFKRVHQIADAAQRIPVRLYLFDLLHLNGKSLINLPYLERRRMLASVAGKIRLASQIVTGDSKAAKEFLKNAMAAGQEGLMAKTLDSPYTPGTRGKRWLKIKPILEPLDLVIVSAEYGYGRRHDWLSDYVLAARDTKTGKFMPVGKTFKGLTDLEIIAMTKRLREIAVTSPILGQVEVLPRVVVEVAYNEIQRSPKYESKMALRFARITRVREDKLPEDSDTVQHVKEIYERQFAKKGRFKTDNLS